MKPERRTLPLELAIERAEGKATKIVGYAARFNTLSEDLGGWREEIAPGAFASVLEDDVRALFNHDPNFPLGRSTAGTLKLKEDDRGLKIEVEVPDTEQARMVVTAIERGDVTGQSFSFLLPPEGGRTWRELDGMYIRTVTKVMRLYDVGPVTFPAYPDTDVAVRSLEPGVAFRAAGDAVDDAVLAEARAACVRPNFDVMRKRLDLAAM